MTTEKPTPATDKEIATWRTNAPFDEAWPRLIARIEDDAKTISGLVFDLEASERNEAKYRILSQALPSSCSLSHPEIRYQGEACPLCEALKLDGAMIDELRHERNVLQKICAERSEEIERLSEALTRLRDCDWTISLPDRMDAVRDIARAALSRLSSDPGAKPSLPKFDGAALGRKIVEDAFAFARAEMRKKHAVNRNECYGDLCICVEPKPGAGEVGK